MMKALLMAIMVVAVTFSAPSFAGDEKSEKKDEKRGGYINTFGDEKKDEKKDGKEARQKCLSDRTSHP